MNDVTNKAIGERIKKLRAWTLSGMSQETFAQKLGVTRGAVGNWELGKGIKRENLLSIAERFDIPAEWLMNGKGKMPSPPHWDETVSVDPEDMPVFTMDGPKGIPADASAQLDVTAGMGGGGFTQVAHSVPGQAGSTFAGEHVRDYWRLPAEVLSSLHMKSRDVVIMAVQGDSMHPTINEGDFVFVDTRHRWPSPDGLYALLDPFGGIVVKRLELDGTDTSDDATLKVISDNPRHSTRSQPLSETRIVGRVVRKFGVVT